jgi:hypothetical protein
MEKNLRGQGAGSMFGLRPDWPGPVVTQSQDRSGPSAKPGTLS